MATLNRSFAFQHTTDAEFRAWASMIHDTLTLSGAWVNTADTGQVDLTTATRPTVANTKYGYKIYRMNDTLQATAPCFMRLDFGAGGVASYPGVWITIGTGSNGSGTITGITFNGGGGNATIQSTGDSTARNSYGSASNNRVSIAINAVSNASYIGFTIERTKDSSGADTATGLIITIIGSQTLVRPSNLSGSSAITSARMCCHYMLWTGTQPTLPAGWCYALANENPSTFASDSGIGIVIPFGMTAKQPGSNAAVCRTSDFILEAQPAVTIYGGSVTYLRTAYTAYKDVANGSADSTAVVMLRYD